ncbi:MAG: hypothetical protein RBU37_21105 [Myxococcota bacterium]|jgi:hypothetical protein|nr:hypothetical protein [Myxococcota bacterium]
MRKFFGALLLFFGLAGAAIEIDNLAKGVSENSVLGFVLAFFFITSGVLLIASKKKAKQAALNAPDASARLLQSARQQRGRVTALELSADTGLPLELVEKQLVEFCERAYCERLVGEAGVLFYRFPEFESTNVKRDILETTEEEAELDSLSRQK